MIRVCMLIIPHSSFIVWSVKYLKIEFCINHPMMTIHIPESITNLGCYVKNKSMQEDDVSKICVRSLIIWCKQFCEVNVSIFAPSN